MLSNIAILLILFFVALVYYNLAKRFNIIDKPNARSSHTEVTVRGGGILFPIAALLWWFTHDFQNTYMIIGMVWIATISLLDDIYDISSLLRIVVQFIALTFAFLELDLFSQVSWYFIPLFYFFGLGVINAVNFMDGINGITALYSLVFFASIIAVNKYTPLFSEELLYYEILAILVFCIFNLRKKALMFAGDIGSISLAYLMIYFLIKWYLLDQNIFIVLILLVYGADVVLTILRRLSKGEKVTQPHRTHLYQYLANQMKIDHTVVAVIYAFLQFFINFLLFIYQKGYPSPILAISVITLISLIHLFVRRKILSRESIG